MAAVGVTRLRVIERDDLARAQGEISVTDLLEARLRRLEEERQREGTLHLDPTRHLHAASPRALSLLRRPLGRQ
jgi:hypothetical protein